MQPLGAPALGSAAVVLEELPVNPSGASAPGAVATMKKDVPVYASGASAPGPTVAFMEEVEEMDCRNPGRAVKLEPEESWLATLGIVQDENMDVSEERPSRSRRLIGEVREDVSAEEDEPGRPLTKTEKRRRRKKRTEARWPSINATNSVALNRQWQ